MTQLILDVTPYPQRVSSSKPRYDIVLGTKSQDTVCIKNPNRNKLELPTKIKLSIEPQLLTSQTYIEKQVHRRINF